MFWLGVTPTDGPIGDSSLWVSDGQYRVLNQNDARPSDLDAFRELGPVDAYLVQFSGAIWFPMVYELPARAKQALGKTKRDRQFDRTLRYIDELDAAYVFPMAGPPCFLDEELWGFNDIFGDEFRKAEGFYGVLAALGGSHLLRIHEVAHLRVVLRAMAELDVR